jgi:glutamate-ammonia-ligase adenylyltransferase
VLDAVIGGSFWAPWPGMAALRAELAAPLAEARITRQSSMARRWMKEWHFRIGVHHLRGLIDGFEAGQAMPIWPRRWCGALARGHGRFSPASMAPMPGRGAVVIGMGSLGAGRLNAGSDLDLIVIYDAAGVEMSDGPRPLATRPYYARLTQAMVTALTAQMPRGGFTRSTCGCAPRGGRGRWRPA